MSDQQRQAAEQVLPFLDRVIADMAEAVLVIDPAGKVVVANQAAADLFGLPDKAGALRPLDEYNRLIRSWRVGGESFPPDELRRAFDGKAIPRQLATITTADGVEHVVEFSATPVQDEQERVILAMMIASDITQEHRASAYERAVATAAQGISTQLDVNRVLETVLDQIAQALSGQVVIGVWRLDKARGELTLMACRGLPEATAEKLRRIPLDCPSAICRAARTRRIQSYGDVRRRPPPDKFDRPLIAEERLAGWVVAPLLSGGRLVGVISYGLRAPRRFYEEDFSAIGVIAGLFGTAIDHAFLYEESQRARQRMEEYISLISHDLRAPVSILQGNAQILQQVADNPDMVRKRAESINAAAKRMNAMIQDLVDSARLEFGQVALKRIPIDVASFILDLKARLAPVSEVDRIRVEMPEAPILVLADPSHLERILTNLLTNALKYSKGQVQVEIERTDAEVEISVIDHGPGISPEDLPHVFERFYRGKGMLRRSGVGLGLYITRLLVEAGGGRIWVKSQLDKGSTFSFTMPVEAESPDKRGGLRDAVRKPQPGPRTKD